MLQIIILALVLLVIAIVWALSSMGLVYVNVNSMMSTPDNAGKLEEKLASVEIGESKEAFTKKVVDDLKPYGITFGNTPKINFVARNPSDTVIGRLVGGFNGASLAAYVPLSGNIVVYEDSARESVIFEDMRSRKAAGTKSTIGSDLNKDLHYIADEINTRVKNGDMTPELQSELTHTIKDLRDYATKSKSESDTISRMGERLGINADISDLSDEYKMMVLVKTGLDLLGTKSESLDRYNSIINTYNSKLAADIEHELIHKWQTENKLSPEDAQRRFNEFQRIMSQSDQYTNLSMLSESEGNLDNFNTLFTGPSYKLHQGLQYELIKDKLGDIQRKKQNFARKDAEWEKMYDSILTQEFALKEQIHEEQRGSVAKSDKTYAVMEKKRVRLKSEISGINKQLYGTEKDITEIDLDDDYELPDISNEERNRLSEQKSELRMELYHLEDNQKTYFDKNIAEKDRRIKSLEKRSNRIYDKQEANRQHWKHFLAGQVEMGMKQAENDPRMSYLLGHRAIAGSDRQDDAGISEGFAWLWTTYKDGFTPDSIQYASNILGEYSGRDTPQYKEMFNDLIGLRSKLKDARDIDDADVMKILLPIQNGMDVKMQKGHIRDSSVRQLTEDPRAFKQLLDYVDTTQDKTRVAKQILGWLDAQKRSMHGKLQHSPRAI